MQEAALLEVDEPWVGDGGGMECCYVLGFGLDEGGCGGGM